MWSIVFSFSLLLGIAFTINGFRSSHHYLWLAGLFFYFSSYLSSWSIGLYVLVLPILLWFFAILVTFKWVKRLYHYLYLLPIGIAIWFLAVTKLDDFYLFYPFQCLAHF